MKRKLILLELAGMMVLTGCVAALATDAVSQANGKMDVFGGRVDGKDSGNIAVSYTFPINRYFGGQIDGLYGRLDNDALFAGGGHLFWRDPELALLGLTASYGVWDHFDLWRVGAEGEVYLCNNLTVAGLAGHQSDDLGDVAYANAELRYYLAGENLMLACGGGFFDDQGMLVGAIEYLTDLDGLSLFASGAVGTDDYDLVIGGIRYYFGSSKSLVLRHRTDDPPNYLFSSFSSTLAPSFTAGRFTVGGGFGERDATPE